MEHNQVTFLSCYMRAAVQLLGVVLSWCKFELHKKKKCLGILLKNAVIPVTRGCKADHHLHCRCHLVIPYSMRVYVHKQVCL